MVEEEEEVLGLCFFGVMKESMAVWAMRLGGIEAEWRGEWMPTVVSLETWVVRFWEGKKRCQRPRGSSSLVSSTDLGGEAHALVRLKTAPS